ncbi:hypothetical protein HNP81_001973 [Peribacillus huizhouensis]|uniref:Uncharacterized protein n=1 Tax=Peribacillus huizhouensis TaxID=1501239 RepID=A0ABR6CNS3_9BACI|nr:hypothetical protein [Peribacillus huizhouensis]
MVRAFFNLRSDAKQEVSNDFDLKGFEDLIFRVAGSAVRQMDTETYGMLRKALFLSLHNVVIEPF